MVKAPPSFSKSSYYSEKYKPWRRGKSIKAKSSGGGKGAGGGGGGGGGVSSSLKHQLRGLERLMAKTKQKLNYYTTTTITDQKDKNKREEQRKQQQQEQ